MSDVFGYLSDWRWRFANLYWINPADPNDPECLFVPREEQWEILEAIYEKGEERIAILKARQLGFSTLLALICLDMIMFKSGFTCGVIDQTKEDAEKKLDKIIFAWERLPDDLRKSFELVALNQSEMSVRLGKKSISTVYAGKNARGGTHHLLWISEWGAIQFDDPTRSDGIADGALPSAKEGIVVVETTWKGGKSGRLFTEIVEPALEMPEEYRTVKDWKVYFFSWWLDKTYRFVGNYDQITAECMKYLDELETIHGITLDKQQRLWYFKMAWPKKAKRFEEFPSRLGEIFLSPTLGSVYGEYMDEAMTDGRIVNFPLGKELPFVFWDLGKRDLTVLLFVQFHGGVIKIFDCHMGRGGNWADYAKVCMEWEREHNTYIAGHYLPHDGGWKRMGTYYNKSIQESLEECGLRNIQVVPVIPKVAIGIDYVRDRIPHMMFHANNLKRVFEFDTKRISFLDAANNYRYEPMGKDSSRVEPIHDINSHPCFVAGTMVETSEGHKPIEKIIVGDIVVTPMGFAKVTYSAMSNPNAEVMNLCFSDGGKVTCTPCHPFLTDQGLTRADALSNTSGVWTKKYHKKLSSKESYTNYRDVIMSRLQVPEKTIATYTELSGVQFMEKYLKGITSTIKMEITSTIKLRIWKQCLLKNIIQCTLKLLNGYYLVKLENACLKKLFQPVKHGTNQKKEENGIKHTGLKYGMIESLLKENVFFVQKLTKQKLIIKFFAVDCVKFAQEIIFLWKQLCVFAHIAKPALSVILKRKKSIAPHLVSGNLQKKKEPVFCITVEKDCCFYANGYLVSNCDALRTLCEADERGMIDRSTYQDRPSGKAKASRQVVTDFEFFG